MRPPTPLFSASSPVSPVHSSILLFLPSSVPSQYSLRPQRLTDLLPSQTPNDRLALLRAAVTSKGKFFLGTDSAPHDISAKKGKGNTAAGVFTQPYAVAYVLTALEEAVARGDVRGDQVTQELLEGFLGGFGRRFYGVAPARERIVVEKKGEAVVESIKGEGLEVVPFRKGKETWSVSWV